MSQLEVMEGNQVQIASDEPGPSIYNFYKHTKFSKYSWPKTEEENNEDESIENQSEENSSLKSGEDFNSIPLRKFPKKQTKRVKRDGEEASYSSEDGEGMEEDEEYQIMRDAGPSRRKRSRSTPNPGPDSFVFLPSGPAEAPAILSGASGAKKTRLCEFCNASDTPMWRRGPSGKGTLCNACGVKWSLNLRKRNNKKDNSASASNGEKHNNGNGQHNRRSPAHHQKNSAETKPKRKGMKKMEGDEDFMEESGEDSSAEATKEYFCTYCGMSWPFGYFKNIQQFGAHCSNCSRKHGKAEGSEEPIIKKAKTEVPEISPAEGLSGLLDAVEDQLAEETTDSPQIQRSPHLSGAESNGHNGSDLTHPLRDDRGQEENRRRHLAEVKVSLLEEFNEVKRDVSAYINSKEELSNTIEKFSKEMTSRLTAELSESVSKILSHKSNGTSESNGTPQSNGLSNGKHDSELNELIESKVSSFMKDFLNKVEAENIESTNTLEENPLIGTENGNRRRFTRNTSLATQNIDRMDKFYHALQHVLSISK
eukprot:TRINITY_DN4377_c0_g1_i1.p1 TRINITY_DN4377_c0_g1~~TRINITY_DN4377_c0_g1_i1.p1  ORF type:complete len:537 (+),score=232.99 TRINITY_DN4377_c0_g1_i1:312-1922(+)